MPQSPDLVVFKRRLISPGIDTIDTLGAALLETAGSYMDVTESTVRAVAPQAAAISILGGNTIELAIRNAKPYSELTYMTPEQIADYVEAKLARLPSFNQPISTACRFHSTQGGRSDRRMLGVQLARSDIYTERHVAQSAIRTLVGRPEGRNHRTKTLTRWLQFYTECPDDLANALEATAACYIPQGTPMIYSPIERVRQGDEKDYR